METLGYTQMALVYEDTIGPLGLRTISLPKRFSLKQVSTAAALIGFIFFGGFTAVVATTLGRSGADMPIQQAPLP